MEGVKGNWKTILGVLALAIIIVLAIFLRGDEGDSNKSYDDYAGSFAIENPDDIARVVITHGRERTIDLKRTGNGWIVNDQYRARQSSIDPLLEVLKWIEVKYIPPKAAEEHITWDIAAHGIQTDVYDREGNLLRAYYVGGSTFDNMGTHVRKIDSDQAFVAHIRTMDGSFRTRFTLTLDEWRDRHFLNIDQKDIRKVEVEYPKQKTQSFVLDASAGDYDVSPMFPELTNYNDTYRNGTAEKYLRALANAACESYDNTYSMIDSVRGLQPFSTVTVTMRDTSENFRMSIYPKGTPVYSEYTGPVHRLMIDLDTGDFLLVQYNVVKDFLRGYDYFHDGPEHELIF